MTAMTKIRNFLGQPYHFYYEGKTFLTLLGLLFVMAMAFNLLFEPFNVYVPEHKMSYFLITVVHSTVACLALSCFYLVMRAFPDQRANWTVGKEILGLGAFLLLAGTGQFLVRDIIYDNPFNWTWRFYLEEVRNTFLVGLLFIAILLPLNFNRLYLANQRKAGLLSGPRDKEDSGPAILIGTQLKSDDFYLNTDHFIYAKSEGNYVTFYIREGQVIQKKLKRISISDLESQLSGIPNVIRTHRSYLVNLRHVRRITGNAQGYKLELNGADEAVAVSRKMIPHFEARMTAG